MDDIVNFITLDTEWNKKIWNSSTRRGVFDLRRLQNIMLGLNGWYSELYNFGYRMK